jgi:hypothetical protein
MLLEEYRKECTIELQFLAEVVQAIESLLAENTGDTAPLKDRAAAASFVFSFYNGIENLLKRTTKYCAVPLPKGEQWHSELAMRFADPVGRGFQLFLNSSPMMFIPTFSNSGNFATSLHTATQ